MLQRQWVIYMEKHTIVSLPQTISLVLGDTFEMQTFTFLELNIQEYLYELGVEKHFLMHIIHKRKRTMNKNLFNFFKLPVIKGIIKEWNKP